jgi:hypothetical protein
MIFAADTLTGATVTMTNTAIRTTITNSFDTFFMLAPIALFSFQKSLKQIIPCFIGDTNKNKSYYSALVKYKPLSFGDGKQVINEVNTVYKQDVVLIEA